MVGGVPDVITCAKFQIEIFMGYDFTGGRIFDFCIDFSMGLTTAQRYCAACDLLDDIALNAHQFRIGLADTRLCQCDRDIEDVHHCLLTCAKYESIRRDFVEEC